MVVTVMFVWKKQTAASRQVLNTALRRLKNNMKPGVGQAGSSHYETSTVALRPSLRYPLTKATHAEKLKE